MQEALPHARTEISQHAPRMMTFKINPEKIRDVIGKGGAVIRALTEETGTTIDIQDDGTVTIASVNADACNVARKRIEDITAEVEVGRIYEGTVLRLLDFGAIVQVLPGKDGLLHISQIAKERVNQVSDYLKEGQVVRVKVLEADDKGRAAPVDEGRGRRRCGEGGAAGGVDAGRVAQRSTRRRVAGERGSPTMGSLFLCGGVGQRAGCVREYFQLVEFAAYLYPLLAAECATASHAPPCRIFHNGLAPPRSTLRPHHSPLADVIPPVFGRRSARPSRCVAGGGNEHTHKNAAWTGARCEPVSRDLDIRMGGRTG